MRKAIVVALLCAFVATGCSASGADGADDGAVTSSLDAPGAATVGGADLGFTARTLDGTSFDGEQLGGKPAVLWFWAPWCPTCRAQAGGVSSLAETYAGDVSVVGVGGLADVQDIRDYAGTVEGPVHLIDEKGAVWRHFGVTAQSSYLVIDADGGIVAEGYLDDQALVDTVDALVG